MVETTSNGHTPAVTACVSWVHRQATVVIPAHNERATLPACLRAVVTAAVAAPIPTVVIVVLDASDDGSAELAGRYGPDVHFVSVHVRNVGAARAAGFRYARTLSAHGASHWYATTDADSRVEPDWLIRQLEHRADMVLGLVQALDWVNHPPDVVANYLRAYHARIGRSHDHVHGANMGFDASAYWRVGGFRALSTGEDVDLVSRIEAAGYRIHWDTSSSVATSTRIEARAPHGFAHHLRQLAASTRECRAGLPRVSAGDRAEPNAVAVNA